MHTSDTRRWLAGGVIENYQNLLLCNVNIPDVSAFVWESRVKIGQANTYGASGLLYSYIFR